MVASEVKSLAVQTAKATEEISNQILSVQASTGNAVEAIARITGRMQEIERFTSAVAAAVEEQNAVTGALICSTVLLAAAGWDMGRHGALTRWERLVSAAAAAGFGLLLIALKQALH